MDWVQAYVVEEGEHVERNVAIDSQDNKAIIKELLDFLVVVEVENKKCLVWMMLLRFQATTYERTQSIVENGKSMIISKRVLVVEKYTVRSNFAMLFLCSMS